MFVGSAEGIIVGVNDLEDVTSRSWMFPSDEYRQPLIGVNVH